MNSLTFPETVLIDRRMAVSAVLSIFESVAMNVGDDECLHWCLEGGKKIEKKD